MATPSYPHNDDESLYFDADEDFASKSAAAEEAENATAEEVENASVEDLLNDDFTETELADETDETTREELRNAAVEDLLDDEVTETQLVDEIDETAREELEQEPSPQLDDLAVEEYTDSRIQEFPSIAGGEFGIDANELQSFYFARFDSRL